MDGEPLPVDRDDLEPLGLLKVKVGGGDDDVVADVPAARVVLYGDRVDSVVRRSRGDVDLKWSKCGS